MIRKEGGYWVLRSKRTPHRVLGRHGTRTEAEKQEKAILLSRLRREGRVPPRTKRSGR